MRKTARTRIAEALEQANAIQLRRLEILEAQELRAIDQHAQLAQQLAAVPDLAGSMIPLLQALMTGDRDRVEAALAEVPELRGTQPPVAELGGMRVEG